MFWLKSDTGRFSQYVTKKVNEIFEFKTANEIGQLKRPDSQYKQIIVLCCLMREAPTAQIFDYTKNPVIRDPSHLYTQLLNKVDQNAKTKGQESEINSLRKMFWILNGRTAV